MGAGLHNFKFYQRHFSNRRLSLNRAAVRFCLLTLLSTIFLLLTATKAKMVRQILAGRFKFFFFFLKNYEAFSTAFCPEHLGDQRLVLNYTGITHTYFNRVAFAARIM